MIRRACPTFLVIAIVLLAFASDSKGEVVTDCSSDADLRAKLTSMQDGTGGTLTFACGATPATITLTAQLPQIRQTTTIDGGNLVTVRGSGGPPGFRIFNVDFQAQLTLRRIVLSDAYGEINDGGAIRNLGRLILDRVKILRSVLANWSGGAIYCADGSRLEITESELSDNQAVNGGAIFAWSNAQVTIRNTVLARNRATGTAAGSGWGGALLLWESADATIEGGSFTDNTAREGGALQSLFNGSEVFISGSRFLGNEARDGAGGAIRVGPADGVGSCCPDAYLTDVTVALNHARGLLGTGGGIYGTESTLELIGVTLAQNTATNRGGGLYLSPPSSPPSLIVNSTISNNEASATYEGGGIYLAAGDLVLTNVTVGGNSAGMGGGIATSSLLPPMLYVQNVLLDLNQNGNCKLGTPPALALSNLSSDNTCAFGSGRDGLDLRLGLLGDNGGPTETQLPLTGSPAIDAGDSQVCADTDQRGAPRPFGSACDVGAVEVGAAVPTTTTTTMPTTTPTTLPSGACSAPCVTTDPCRPEACVQGACLAQDVTGFAGATCACERPEPAVCAGQPLAPKILKATSKACTLLTAAASGTPGTRRVRKQLTKAGKKWRMAGRLVLKRAARLPTECATALSADYNDAANRAKALRTLK